MLNWIDIIGGVTPPENRPLLCYCPEWSETGYQVAMWNGDEFYYSEQPNDSFNANVENGHYFLKPTRRITPAIRGRTLFDVSMAMLPTT